MRSEKFYRLIGAFVIGAFVLMLLALVYFYREYMSSRSQMYVMLFKGSLKGLNLTTQVTYRGIKIGEVKVIEITENKNRDRVKIPVYVQFSVEKNLGFTQDPVHLLIRNGYIAQVSNPNFLTGNAEIELVKSDASIKPETTYRGYPVFPTGSRIKQAVSLDDSIKSAKMAFEAIRDFINSEEIKNILRSTKDMTKSIDGLAVSIDKYIPPTMIDIMQTMQKIDGAASSAQNLTDYLSRNPESLIRGKQ